MLNKKTSILVSCFVMLFPLLSFGFDCNHPDFGSTIQELNKDGYFVKYMEKGGVSYYNYTGSCRMEMHSFDNPAIAFAFVEDQLFARIIRAHESDLETSLATLEERVSKQIGTSHIKKKQEGDLLIYQWVNEKDKTQFKIKINKKINEQKGAWYFEPLREKLKSKSQAGDPVDEME
jgi:hypothetical protein